MRLPTYKELRRFVDVEGGTDKDKASGKSKGDHHRYTFQPPTGEPLYTKVSHGSGQIGNPDLFKAILRDQLCVDEDQFWAAVDDDVKPTRPAPGAPEVPGPSLDAKLARNLHTRVGLPWSVIGSMSQADAVATWQEYLMAGGT